MDKETLASQREAMIAHALVARGIRSELVLGAMRDVPREAFLPPSLTEFAYEDAPLPIAANQTISQPYIVALMIESLDLRGGERILEVGTGSGYAAAVLSRIGKDVFTVERIGQLAEKAAATLAGLAYANVHVLHADGTRGWPEHAPYDAIIVAAGGPRVPRSLKTQLAIGGRLVIPIGNDRSVQELVRVTRTSLDAYVTEDIADVRFVPLLGAEGWGTRSLEGTGAPRLPREAELPAAVSAAGEPFDDIETADLARLLARIGDSRLVLLGEATHGTSEFYRMRARISRELIERKGFDFIAIEGDWPDAARIDHYVRDVALPPPEWTAFARFPTWMWRNLEVAEFVHWLRAYNANRDPAARISFHGLDLYSLHNSIRSVLTYLDDVDPDAARTARHRYGCLTPWQSDPATYGHAALTGHYQTCEREVVSMLTDLLGRQRRYAERDGERFLDAVQNARLVASAERYYRTMYYGSRASWNLRDSHMFETLQALMAHHGGTAKGIIWAHNSHVGASSATEMASRGEYNVGELCRQAFGTDAYLVGFGTHGGTVAAASEWDAPMEVMRVRAAVSGSYEAVCHAAGGARWLLPLRHPNTATIVAPLMKPLLERAIGVVYRPHTEMASHYFQAVLPRQFDEYIWFDATTAVTPLDARQVEGMPETYPFGV